MKQPIEEREQPTEESKQKKNRTAQTKFTAAPSAFLVLAAGMVAFCLNILMLTRTLALVVHFVFESLDLGKGIHTSCLRLLTLATTFTPFA